MQKSVPEVVMTYYLKHWADIKEQWVKYLTFQNLCLSNATNNRLESINGKLKSVINRYSSLEDFIKHFFALINSVRAGNDVKNSQMLIKNSRNFDEGSPEFSYNNLLTSFAFEKVKNQINLSKDCKDLITIEENKYYLANTSEGLINVSPTSCECMFRKSTMLPCRHIFKCRNFLELPLYDESLCLSRWTKMECENILEELDMNTTSKSEKNVFNIKVLKEQKPAKRLTNHEKFRLMDEQRKIMAKLCSEVSTPIFLQRINFIKNTIEDWRNGRDIDVNFGAPTNITVDANNSDDTNIITSNVAANKKIAVDTNVAVESNNTVDTNVKADTNVTADTNFTADTNVTVDINVVVDPNVSADIKVAVDSNNADDTNIAADTNVVASNVSADTNVAVDTNIVSQTEYDLQTTRTRQLNLKDIKMPAKILKRGRPKGCGNTVIGLVKKRCCDKENKRQSTKRNQIRTKRNESQGVHNIQENMEEEYLEEEYLEEEYLEEKYLEES